MSEPETTVRYVVQWMESPAHGGMWLDMPGQYCELRHAEAVRRHYIGSSPTRIVFRTITDEVVE